ncbi:MAG: class I SAM-dependent methyltransferase [Actinomycetota bacterium]|nr:class I SAM-dependent methyltransferase [Actinomycetota bacterium]
MSGQPAGWREYLRSYHEGHAGITEALLRHCRADPYQWLLDGQHTTGRRVLDLASGSGPLAEHLRAASYLGVDSSAAELKLAAGRHAQPAIRADATRLPMASSSVDLVVCSMALQVLTPLPEVLAEIARVLRPRGRLIAMLPVSRPLTARDRVRYAQVLLRLRRWRLGYANARPLRALRGSGWRIESQTTRRFGYPILVPDDGQRLIEAFYLPATSPCLSASAVALARRWCGVEMGIPLQRIVASPPPGRGDPAARA